MKITSGIKRNVVTIDEHSTAAEAAIRMADKHIGALVVTGGAGVIGLFTERDLMVRVVAERKKPTETPVKDVMSEQVVRISADETCERGLEQMKEHYCRHLFIFENDEFVGIVSLRDIVVLMIREREEMIARLKEYISG